MKATPDTPRILYVDFPAESDNHLRNLAGIRRYASARGWDVATLPREETSRDAVKALCAGADDASPFGPERLVVPPTVFILH